MSKVQISGGVISVEDGIKKAEEYAPPRKVRVELHFDVPEGSDPVAHIDAVSALVQQKLAALLAGKTVAPQAASAAPTAAPSAPAGEKTLSDKDALAKAAGLPTKDLEARPRAPRQTKAEKEAAAKAADAAKSAVDPDDLSGPIEPEAPAAKVENDDELFTVEPEEITDADLNHIVQTKNGELDGKGGPAIKKIISAYNTDPTKAFTLKQIPQASRAEFKARINALTAKDLK